MFFICAILFAACCSFAADWSDVATKPSQVQVDGKPYYEISSAKELAWFSNEVASGKNNINAILKNDIVLWDSVSGDTNYWTPIGLSQNLAYEGVFRKISLMKGLSTVMARRLSGLVLKMLSKKWIPCITAFSGSWARGLLSRI